MHIFLSSLQNADTRFIKHVLKSQEMLFNLLSYYYIAKNPLFKEIALKSREMIYDSGAHSFQKGKKVNWEEYTHQYADFIKKADAPNVVGFFEMDIDIVKGYDYVLHLRRILEKVSDKIIPVWHRNRGIADFKRMCDEYSGRVVAVSGFKNQDIRDEDYIKFVNYAHSKGCRIHGLGLTREKILRAVPFDYADSSSWLQTMFFGRIYRDKNKTKLTRGETRGNRWQVQSMCYAQGVQMQKEFMRLPGFPPDLSLHKTNKQTKENK